MTIHTGNWGCGAFGGNVSLMALLQIAAACLAGAERIIYHSYDEKHAVLYRKGVRKLKEIWPKKGESLSTFAMLSAVAEEGYEWGVGNGT
jgi:hypothetical protein